MNLHYHRKNAGFENIDNYEADLIILNNFVKAKEIYDIIKANNDFDNVILIDKAFNKGKLHALYTLMDVISPSFYLNDKYDFPFSMKNRYDVLTVPKYSTVLGAIYRLNKNAKLDLFEDGLGSYFLKPNLLLPRSRLYKFIYEKGLAKDFTHFDAIYLNSPELYTGTMSNKVVKIPSYNEDYLKKVQSYFEQFSKVDHEENKNIYWLAQTLENDEAIKTINSVLQCLEQYKDQVLYCPHPRWSETKNKVFDMAPEKQIWEMKLLNMDNVDDKLFISIHSTACMSPKMLFDKEPYLIMFYPMIDEEVADSNKEFMKTMELFKDLYRNKDKIMTPHSIDELKQCLERYTNRA